MDEKKLGVLERKILRKIVGPKENEEGLKLGKMKSLENYLEKPV